MTDNLASGTNAETVASCKEDIPQMLADAITGMFDSTLGQLIALRESVYASAIEALNNELEALAKEHGQLEEDIRAIEVVLPSKERLTRHEADELLLSGKPDAARDKLAELEVFKSRFVVMRGQLGVIHDRFQSINQEKRDIAKQVFEDWLKVVRPVVRASEHGLLITLLNGLEESFYQFQASTGTGTSDNRQRPLLNQGHFSSLTADGRSAEWAAGHHWYA
jgi:hypothetical protein